MVADQSAAPTMDAILYNKLKTALEPLQLEVINDSHLHAGHRGSPGTGESHFTVIVISPKFAGISRVARHRLVNEAVAEELRSRVHALAIKAYAPGEPLS